MHIICVLLREGVDVVLFGYTRWPSESLDTQWMAPLRSCVYKRYALIKRGYCHGSYSGVGCLLLRVAVPATRHSGDEDVFHGHFATASFSCHPRHARCSMGPMVTPLREVSAGVRSDRATRTPSPSPPAALSWYGRTAHFRRASA